MLMTPSFHGILGPDSEYRNIYGTSACQCIFSYNGRGGRITEPVSCRSTMYTSWCLCSTVVNIVILVKLVFIFSLILYFFIPLLL
jgi:hypothetical protein